MLMKNPSDTRKRRNVVADLVELGAAVTVDGGDASDGDAWGGLHRCHLGCNLVQNMMSQTPYKGDAETAENERKWRFWLFGL